MASFLLLFLIASLPASTNSLSFDFPNFDQNKDSLDTQDSASFSNSQLQLTPTSQSNGSLNDVHGRAFYKTAVPLWDASTKRTTDFSTSFTFNITSFTSNFGDGLAFLLVPPNLQFMSVVGGEALGIYPVNMSTPANYTFGNNTKIVAVEFDPSGGHIGIDVNQIKSSAYVNVSDGLVNKTSQAFISYNSTTKNLSVSLSVEGNSVPYTVSQAIDLSTVLPERIQVGFSAATGANAELHNILNWSFNSTLEETVATSPAQPWKKGKGSGLVAGIAVGISFILIFWIRLRRKIPGESNIQFGSGEDFDVEAGPKKFTYAQLSQATNNFNIQEKLGEGGFGAVYKGLLTGPGCREIAVKKIKIGSNLQGIKEYGEEVKIISRIMHRNLVQLLGWCHDNGELLLVYEFIPNRSLDFHLFGHELVLLPWETRYKIALGLASAMIYLHEEWEQAVVHRDIKSSNVMLDSNFNPKLGDFGLARLVDHDVSLGTMSLAGTPGYMAPECFSTGKASKESDVYSFGIVALEIVCGRKVIEVKDPSIVNLVEWVWDLYGKGMILDAVDNNLEGEFDEEQAKRLMVVGLWCSHPVVGHRPSISEAIAALNEEAPLPSLPPQLSVPIFESPDLVTLQAAASAHQQLGSISGYSSPHRLPSHGQQTSTNQERRRKSLLGRFVFCVR